jgi:hypothetical protein
MHVVCVECVADAWRVDCSLQTEITDLLSAETLEVMQRYTKLGQNEMIKRAAKSIAGNVLGDSRYYQSPKGAPRDFNGVSRESMMRDAVGVESTARYAIPLVTHDIPATSSRGLGSLPPHLHHDAEILLEPLTIRA